MKKTVIFFLMLISASHVYCEETAREIVMGPYIQNVTKTEASIIWFTNLPAGPSPDTVEYTRESGRSEKLSAQAVEAGPAETGFKGYFRQKARLSGLEKAKAYRYRVRGNSGRSAFLSSEWTFRTAPDDLSGIRFAFLGDGRTDNDAILARHRAVFKQALDEGPELIIYGGDMVLNGSQEHWKRFMTQVLCSNNKDSPGTRAGHTVPVYMAVGNHEIEDAGGLGSGNPDTSMKRFGAICDNPENGSSKPEWEGRYYAFSRGPCYFIVLDANNTSDPVYDNNLLLPDGATPDWHPGSEQFRWMISRLEYAQKIFPFTFVIFHPAPYCRGIHGSPDDEVSGYRLRALDGVFRKYGVDAVLTSHDHMVERSVTGPDGYHKQYPKGMADPLTWGSKDNLNYVVQGNSGEGSRSAASGWQKWMSMGNNGREPFYTVYFYGAGYDADHWEGYDSFSSFLSVNVFRGFVSGNWRAEFKTIRTDVLGKTSIHDAWILDRR